MIDIMSLMLNKDALEGRFRYHQHCEDQQLTHLCFADDLLIFSEDSLAGDFSVLSDFEKMFGLAVNISQTSLFGSSLSDDLIQCCSSRFGLTPITLHVRYLEIPLCSKKLSFADCEPLQLQIKKEDESWSTRALSMAERLTMLSTIISGIIRYLTSAFFLPKKVIKAIKSLCSSFMWHGSIDVHTNVKVA